MGTNFYAKALPCMAPCPHCKVEDLHIGKSSAGWKFLFHGIPEHDPPLTSWAAWRRYLEGATITDEYGKEWSLAEFIERVEKRRTPTDRFRPICHVGYASQMRGAHHDADGHYHDDEGFDFYDKEFF